jgi:DNA-binding winged helix-turn-helix (wHTH) protein/TolB-like protein/Flp pilus assembly protein TadD
MSDPDKQIYEFGEFYLDVSERRLLRNGVPLPLSPKVFDTLILLVNNSGRLVEKDRLLKELWPDTFVEEVNLSVNVSALRKVLGESESGKSYIETVPKRGYRFTAEVRRLEEVSEDLIVHQRLRAQVVTEKIETPPLSFPTLKLTPAPGNRRRALQIVSSCVIMACVMIAAWFWHRSGKISSAAPATPIKSIAVLPFKPLVPSSGDETLELGMTDVFITKLSHLRQLEVRPTSAIRKYARPDQDAVAAGQELKVEAVLEGNIQKLDDRVRVTVRLLRVGDGSPLWAGQFDQKMNDIFAVEDSISTQVIRALQVHLSSADQKQVTRHYTDDPVAYEYYLKGRYFWNKRTADGLRKAIDYFQLAIDRDSSYALAHSGQALSYVPLGRYGYMSPAEAHNKARVAARKALELDDSLAEAHNAMAVVQKWSWNWVDAEKEYKRALELDPEYAPAHQWYSEFLLDTGRSDEARAEIEVAQKLDPTSLVINSAKGMNEYYLGQYDEAVKQLQAAAELDPNFVTLHWFLGLALTGQGKFDPAIAELRRAVDLSGGSKSMQADLGYSYAVGGHTQEAQAILADLINLSKKQSGFAYDVAVVNLGLGKKAEALSWLEKAYDEHSSFFEKLGVDPRLNSLRSEPEFIGLMEKVGLKSNDSPKR